jgi:hypothetical protein
LREFCGQVGYDVNSTMIIGERDMLVIDPQSSLSEVYWTSSRCSIPTRRFRNEVLQAPKNLSPSSCAGDLS